MALEPGSTLGQYEILSRLGAGGMGEVYRARDTKLGREVAIKTLLEEVAEDPDRLARFEREARVLASLNHPNIATLHGFDVDGDTRFLVMELVEGETLADRIARGPIPVEEAIPLFIEIAKGLAAAHDAGVVHRDLKPANVKLGSAAGPIKILDFGLAKAVGGTGAFVESDSQSPTLTDVATQRGEILGTLLYMSPEQARGQTIDRRTDLWAFGCLLYEALAGRRPFAGETPTDIVAAIVRADPDWERLPAIPRDLRHLLGRCLTKEVSERLADIADARAELERASSSVAASFGGLAAQLMRAGWSRRLMVGLSVATVAAIVATVLLRDSPSLPPTRSEWVQLTNFTDSVTSPALSPDGRMLAFVRATDPFLGRGQVYLKMLPHGEAVQLTDDDKLKMSPRFSPDGSEVAYTTVGAWDTWVVPVLGGEPWQLLPNASGLSWIESDRLLYSQLIEGEGNHMGIATSTESRTESRDVYVPAKLSGMAHRSYLSPDGQWVLLAEMDEIGWMPCRLVPMDGSSRGRSVGPPEAQCRSAAWSPDGRWMYLTSEAGGAFHIWRQRFPDGEPEQVTSGPTEEIDIALTPDGSSFVTSVGSRQRTLWLQTPDGERQLTSEGVPSYPILTADGETLYYLTSSRQSRAFLSGTLTALDLQTGRRQALLPDFVISNYDVSRDAAQVAFISIEADESPRLWIAPLDRRSPPREIPSPAPSMVAFRSNDELLVLETEGAYQYLVRIRTDGGERTRVVSERLTRYLTLWDNIDVSPDGEWVAGENQLPEEEQIVAEVSAYPLNGQGVPVRICNDCVLEWGPAGRFLYLDYISKDLIFVLPIPEGSALPALPDGGLPTHQDAAAFPGVEILDIVEEWETAFQFEPGPDPATYVYFRTTVHRNLYRIPVPP